VTPYLVAPDHHQSQEDTFESLSPFSSSPSPPDSHMVDPMSSMKFGNDTNDRSIHSDSIQATVRALPEHFSNQTTSHQTSEEPSTPISTPSLNAHSSDMNNNTPATPTRLGPTWKTETAPPSEVADEEYDELESENEDISRSSPIFDIHNRVDERSNSSSPSLFGFNPTVAQFNDQSHTKGRRYGYRARVDCLGFHRRLRPRTVGRASQLIRTADPPFTE
jgi:hypothetical protein